MGSKKNQNQVISGDENIKVLSEQPADALAEMVSDSIATDAASGDSVEMTESTNEATGSTEAAKPTKAKVAHQRSVRYVATRAQVDKTKTYDVFAAVELIKKLSYTKFDGTVSADVVLREIGDSITLTFPHTTGKTVRVAIANDEVIEAITAGTIDFDILVSSAQFMPKLARLAKVLGPKGLMPNPKNGTITENPELKKKELEGGQVTIKTEKKAPLMHVTIGKVSADTKDLVDNINALIAALGMKALKMTLCATMSPSVKVSLG